MNGVVKTENLSFDLQDDKIRISVIPAPQDVLMTAIGGTLIATVSLLGLGVFCFIFGSVPHGIIFSLFGFLIDYMIITINVHRIKREKLYLFTIDSSGVSHRDINRTYCIPWSEVCSWGYVNDNVIFYMRSGHSPKQVCLYFSKNQHSEKQLRKKFSSISSKYYHHASSDNMLVLCFYENEIEQELYDHINSVIYTYCEKSKQRDFIREKENL